MATRFNFLLSLATPGLLTVDSPTPEVSLTAFDLDAFYSTLARPAQHKQCFTSRDAQNGAVLVNMRTFLNSYSRDLKQPLQSLHAVAVLYSGFLVFMGFNDTIWNDLIIPWVNLHATSPASKLLPGAGNIYYRPSVAVTADNCIETLVTDGCSFFLCNHSMTGLAQRLAQDLQLEPDEVKARFIQHLVPGAMVVPSGIMAINACQEARFTYCFVN
jgi:intracellular sulfur oxidation DsrE/DsrF family protein